MSKFEVLSQEFTHGYTIPSVDVESSAQSSYKILINGESGAKEILINFQDGPVKEAGVNGIFVEDLLTIAVARLKHFQSGEFPSERNEQAIKFIKSAHHILNERTRERVKRGVEGLSKK